MPLKAKTLGGGSKGVETMKQHGWKAVSRAVCEIEGWERTTHALEVEGGTLYQTGLILTNPDSSMAVSTALAFVPAQEKEKKRARATKSE
ncbi:MAG: hypothetical protein KKH70_20745 [Gammaproteobacteria bacterium]|nr:hypothetical protein [Gammaproteobacteria bacterium]MBU2685639.1 hypothetical protein [Gammaproteobacteria bacterium]